MLSADGLIDGSYDITVRVTDLQTDKTIRVRGDVHIGGLMLRVVNALDAGPLDWSDHAIWWPTKNTWLLRSRRTLDQYDVPAGAVLWFTPMHRRIRVNFPDLQLIDVRINFSANVFNNVISICKNFGIRHPEELSLLQAAAVTRAVSKPPPARTRPTSFSANPALMNSSGTSLDRCETASIDSASADVMLGRSMPNLFDANETCPASGSGYGSRDQMSVVGLPSLTCSPNIRSRDAVNLHVSYKPQTYVDRAKVNSRWLDSSRSLMEQGVTEEDVIFLRYKYASFFDLTPKYDAVRINQIYQQARWSLLAETVHCTEEEMILFAALQLHIRRHERDSNDVIEAEQCPRDGTKSEEIDNIEAALDSLQMSLEGQNSQKTADITVYPELKDYHMFLKSKKSAFNRFKQKYCIFQDTQLNVYRKAEDSSSAEASFNLRGCVVHGEADVGAGKFLIKLTTMPAASEPSVEIILSQNSLEKHATWLAAFQTASRRRTMADVTFPSELESILDLLALRQRKTTTQPDLNAVSDVMVDELEDFISERILRKAKKPQILKRMLEVTTNLSNMSHIEAKLTFIKAWQNLPDAGLAYFVITFKGSTKKELIAVGVQQLVHLDLKTGKCLNAWPYDKMKSWAVNWNTEQLKIELEEHHDSQIAFNCVSANVKSVHEYIGGYVFLAMRSLNKNQTLDEQLFQKLTGGRH